jgi:hypothetical protein
VLVARTRPGTRLAAFSLEEEVMNKPMGIDPTQAREKVRSGQAILVCAYDDEMKCRDIMLDGSVMLAEFQAAAERSKDREVIFFCA